MKRYVVVSHGRSKRNESRRSAPPLSTCITQRAWDLLLAAARRAVTHKGGAEVMLFGVAVYQPALKRQTVLDVYLGSRQRVTGGSTRVPPEVVAEAGDWYRSHVDALEKRVVSRNSVHFVWIHSHGTMPAFNSSIDIENTKGLLSITENVVDLPPEQPPELPVQRRRDGFHIAVSDGLTVVLGPARRGSGAPARAVLVRARSFKTMTSVVVNARGDSDVETHSEASRCPLCRRRAESVTHETAPVEVIPGPPASADEVGAMQRAVDERVTTAHGWRRWEDDEDEVRERRSSSEESEEPVEAIGEPGPAIEPLSRSEIVERLEHLEQERDRLRALLDALDAGGVSAPEGPVRRGLVD